MKKLYFTLGFIFTALLLIGCAGKKGFQEKAPAQFQSAYYTEDAGSLQLFIPVSAIQIDRVSLNSVYFRGKKADLQEDPNRPGSFLAIFDKGKADYVMHSDPKKEYGNKMHEAVEKIPFELEKDEAVIVFTENEKEKFYKLRGIVDRTPQ